MIVLGDINSRYLNGVLIRFRLGKNHQQIIVNIDFYCKLTCSVGFDFYVRLILEDGSELFKTYPVILDPEVLEEGEPIEFIKGTPDFVHVKKLEVLNVKYQNKY